MAAAFFIIAGIICLQFDWSRQLLKSVYYGESKYCIKVIQQYFRPVVRKPKNTIQLKIDAPAFESLQIHSKNASLKTLLGKNEKQFFPVLVNDSIKGRIRLKGNLNEHRIENQWSFKVNLSKGLTLLSCEEFCLLKPERRGIVSELFMHEFLKKEGFISLHYDFINLQLNNLPISTYAIEEGFNDTLLFKNKRTVSPIIKLDDYQYFIDNRNNLAEGYPAKAKIDCSNKKGKLETDILEAKKLLSDFCTQKKSASQVFDIEKIGSFFATMDLLGNTHSIVWYNIRFYYNKTNQRLEPIGYDGNRHDNIENILYSKWLLKKYPVAKHVWIDNFFQDPTFIAAYFKALKRISSPNYLENFMTSINDKLELNTQIIQSDHRYYLFYDYKYFINRDLILRELTHHKK